MQFNSKKFLGLPKAKNNVKEVRFKDSLVELSDIEKDNSSMPSGKANSTFDPFIAPTTKEEKAEVTQLGRNMKTGAQSFKGHVDRLKNFLTLNSKFLDMKAKGGKQRSRKIHDSGAELLAKEMEGGGPNLEARRNSRVHSPMAVGRKRNHLMIFVLIVRFITFLRLSVLSKKLALLNNFHYKVLEENIYYPEFRRSLMEKVFKNLSRFETLIKKKLISLKPFLVVQRQLHKLLSFIRNRINLMEPDQIFFIYWNILVMIFLGLNVIHVPLCLSFELIDSDYFDNIWIMMDDVPNIVMIANILIELNSSYYLKGVYVNSRRKILSNYLKNNMVLDICTLSPYFASKILTDLPDWGIIHYKIFYLLRFFYLIPKVHLISEQLSLKRSLVYLIEALKLIFSIFYMAHILCTFWHWLGRYGFRIGVENNWLSKYEIISENWKVKYVWSMYFSLTTMVTVGYGDIVPQTTLEKTFAIFAMVLACGAFGYFLNYVGSIVQEAWRQEGELKSQIVDILRLLKSRNVGKTLQVRIKRYIEYMNKEKREAEICRNLFTNLSKSLRNELFEDMYGNMLESNPVFSANFSKPFLRALTAKMREMKYVPEDIIVFGHELSNPEMYFIIKGSVDLGILRKERGKPDLVIKEAVKGESFGELSFFTAHPQDLTARAREITTLAVLSVADFLAISEDFLQDRERFFEIRDRLIQRQDIGVLQKTCFSCGGLAHLPADCKLLNYKPSRERVIKRHIDHIASRASGFKRKPREKWNARGNMRLGESEAHRLVKVLEDENFFSDQSSFCESEEAEEERMIDKELIEPDVEQRKPDQAARKTIAEDNLAAFGEKMISKITEDKRQSKVLQNFPNDKSKQPRKTSLFNANMAEFNRLAQQAEPRKAALSNRKYSSSYPDQQQIFGHWENFFDAFKVYKNYMFHNNIDRVLMDQKRSKQHRKTHVSGPPKSPISKRKKTSKL